ncbi:MAG: hypothetical protein U5N85_16140 [Arcicella sp.]|nr:hypothetical protein [Arcicella sp.]
MVRKTNEQHSVIHSNLLYGSSGVALLYNKLFQITKFDAYQKGASYWYEKTCQLYLDDLQNNLFQSSKSNIFEGEIGLKLTLLSYQSNKKLSWEGIYGLKFE